MKTLIGILVSLFISQHLLGQTNIYHPFPDSNVIWREWRVATDGSFGEFEWEEEKFINGDTVIGLYTYHKIYESGLLSHHYIIGGGQDTSNYYYNEGVGLIREDSSRRVYVSNSPDVLLYDFNLHIGDTLPECLIHSTPDTIVVSDIDSVFDGTNFRKRFILSSNSIDPLPSIIEGIGSTGGLFTDLEAWTMEMGGYLHCFMQNDSVKFTDNSMLACDIISNIRQIDLGETFKIYPNPFSQDATIVSRQFQNPFQLKIFNPLGELLRNETIANSENYVLHRNYLPDGIYIVEIVGTNFKMHNEMILVKN